MSLVDKTEWGYMTVLWLLAPVCEGCTYIIVLGCLTHPHKLQGKKALFIYIQNSLHTVKILTSALFGFLEQGVRP